MGANRHSNTRAQAHILTKGTQASDGDKTNPRGDETLRVRGKIQEVRKVAEK